MKRFRISFNGRTQGAIGIFYRISLDVLREAMDIETARAIAYEKHEHIMALHFEEIRDEDG